MDKLKQNAFWIGVGGVGLVLLALVYFLVVQPLDSLAAMNDSVKDLREKYTRAAQRKDPQGKPAVATTKYADWLKRRKKADEAARDQAVELYVGQGKGLTEYLEGFAETPPQPADFAARYKDEIEKPVKAYRDKHKIPEVPEKPEETLPKVDMLAADSITEANVPGTMKELWIILAVFEAVNKLELGGLKEINFTGRATAEKETPLPYNKWVGVKVTIELPFSKLENLLTELYAAPRVPFQLEDLECRKIPESLSQFLSIQRTKRVQDNAEWEKASYEAEIPEPPVHCDITLAAFDWTGLPAEPTVEETTDEGGADAKKKKKKKPGTGDEKPKKPKAGD